MGPVDLGFEASAPHSPTRFDRKLSTILQCATAIFCEKGYERASMRDLSRVTGMSTAGLYHYFESKDKLLYLIQKDLFSTVMELLAERLKETSGAEARVRVFILNHVEFFLPKTNAIKVLSHEDDVLRGDMGSEIAAIKRRYYHCCKDLIDALKAEHNLEFNSRTATMGLFGMINWLHAWYNPRVDSEPGALAAELSEIFLNGIHPSPARRTGEGR